jgi:hypothetical protein
MTDKDDLLRLLDLAGREADPAPAGGLSVTPAGPAVPATGAGPTALAAAGRAAVPLP